MSREGDEAAREAAEEILRERADELAPAAREALRRAAQEKRNGVIPEAPFWPTQEPTLLGSDS